uniref:Uncharacterized protein n=1 Tax=Aegilops tauschii subsp. strangulata TaxID=200361 RepID=A0A453LZG4_AEGTS
RKMMNYDHSSNEEYGTMELDQMIQDEFFDSSDSDKEVDMIMLISMQEEMDQHVEYIHNCKGSIKGRRVVNQDRVSVVRYCTRTTLLRTQLFWMIHGFFAVFCMRKSLVLRIVEGVEEHDDYFKMKRDCCAQFSFYVKQKCTVALRMLALGTTAYAVGEMVRMGEITCMKSPVKFACAMVQVFGAEYLREPNAYDTKKLLTIEEARGFQGML